MKFLIENGVNGQSHFNVVEADTPIEAMNIDMFDHVMSVMQEEQGKETPDVATMGVYEIGQTNLLEAIVKNMDTHSYYQKQLNK